MAISLKGKTAIVTGASSGFGKAIASALQEAGVKVAVGARRVDRLGGDFQAHLDVTDPESSEAFVAKAVEALGGLDILVNNAGGAIGRYPFTESNEEDVSESTEASASADEENPENPDAGENEGGSGVASPTLDEQAVTETPKK